MQHNGKEKKNEIIIKVEEHICTMIGVAMCILELTMNAPQHRGRALLFVPQRAHVVHQLGDLVPGGAFLLQQRPAHRLLDGEFLLQ